MFKIILLGHFLLLSTTMASTKYIWMQAEEKKLETGYCLEVNEGVDLKNFIRKKVFQYALKVKTEKCRPDNVENFFNASLGKCFSADQETKGQKYFKYLKTEKCKPHKTSFVILNLNSRARCYEVDKKTKGKEYYKKVKPEKCIDKESKIVWISSDNKSGRCYIFKQESHMKLQV